MITQFKLFETTAKPDEIYRLGKMNSWTVFKKDNDTEYWLYTITMEKDYLLCLKYNYVNQSITFVGKDSKARLKYLLEKSNYIRRYFQFFNESDDNSIFVRLCLDMIYNLNYKAEHPKPKKDDGKYLDFNEGQVKYYRKITEFSHKPNVYNFINKILDRVVKRGYKITVREKAHLEHYRDEGDNMTWGTKN